MTTLKNLAVIVTVTSAVLIYGSVAELEANEPKYEADVPDNVLTPDEVSTQLLGDLLSPYGPLEPWFDKSWKPGDLEMVE
jgi:hypothetical protein